MRITTDDGVDLNAEVQGTGPVSAFRGQLLAAEEMLRGEGFETFTTAMS
jgi:hypothetical protein